MTPHLEGIRAGEAMVRMLDGTPETHDGVMTAWRGYLLIRVGQLQVKGLTHAQALDRMQVVTDAAIGRMQQFEAELAEHMRTLVLAAPVASEAVQ